MPSSKVSQKLKRNRIMLSQILPELLNFLKGKKKEEFVSSLFFLMTIPNWNFEITPSRGLNSCHFFLSFEANPDLIRFGLEERWLEKVKESSKTIACCAYCYLFNVPGYKIKDVHVFGELEEYEEDGHKKWWFAISAFLKDLEVLRQEIFGYMIKFLEGIYGKDIEAILIDHLTDLLRKGKRLKRLKDQNCGKDFERFVNQCDAEKLVKWVLYFSDNTLCSLNPRAVKLYKLSHNLNFLKGIKEWKNLMEILTGEGLIDEFCNPQVPIREIIKRVKGLGFQKTQCPFCGEKFGKWRRDQVTCGESKCRMRKSRLKKKIVQLIKKNPKLNSKEIASIVKYEKGIVELILKEIRG